MNAIKIITSAGLGLLMAVSCRSSEESYITEKPLTPVTISTTVCDLTKAGHPEGDLAGGSLGLFFYSDGTDRSNGTYNAANREVAWAAGDWVIKGGDLLWADDNTTATFFAYHPYSADLSSTQLTATVPAVQTADNILANDLLYCSPATATKNTSGGSIHLDMKHALSKFRITVSYGTEMAAGSSVTKVTVDDCATSGVLDLEAGSWVGGSNGNVTTIQMCEETGGYECILVPQSAKYRLTFVVSDNGAEKTFEYTPDAAQTFEAGVEYTLPVQIGGDVTKAGITSSASWVESSGGDLTNK